MTPPLAERLAIPAEALSPAFLNLEAPLQLRRRGVELKLVATASRNRSARFKIAVDRPRTANPDQTAPSPARD